MVRSAWSAAIAAEVRPAVQPCNARAVAANAPVEEAELWVSVGEPDCRPMHQTEADAVALDQIETVKRCRCRL